MELLIDGTRQAEIGLIPNDWEIMNLGSLIHIKNGFAFSSEYFSKNGHILLTPGNFSLEGGLYFNDKNTKRFSGEVSEPFRLKVGDLLIVMTDLTSECNLLGKPAFVNIDNLLHNQRIGKISLINNMLVNNYLYHFLNSNLFNRRMKETATGSTVRHTSVGSIYGTILIFPKTKIEQTRIASALNDVDAWIQSLVRLIDKKRQIKQGAMQSLFNPYEDGQLKKGWMITSLFDLADQKKELFNDGDWIESEHITSSGVRLIQTGNIGIGYYVEKDAKKYIYEESFIKLRCKQLRKGDLLICRLAEPAGRACIFPDIGEEQVVTSVDVTIFRPRADIVDRVYLMNLFSTNDWFAKVGESVGGTTHKRISRGALGRIEVALPSIEKQRSTANILSSMTNEITMLETKLTKAHQIKQGMMQNLLTGRIRLV